MREQQLAFTTLGGETGSVRLRGKHYIEPRGYAARPGSGPKDETCRSCRHVAYATGTAGSYPKCGLARAAWTRSRKTDILLKSPACEKWEPNQ